MLHQLKNRLFLGIFFFNSNAQVFELLHVRNPDTFAEEAILNFVTTGGIIDLFFFFGNTPENVVRAFHRVIGRPEMPPFWALGLHMESERYSSTGELALAF